MIYRKAERQTESGTTYLLFVFLAALALGGCSGTGDDSGRKAAAPVPIIKGLTLETVALTSLPESYEAVGTIRARTSAMVSARVPGVISLLMVREGDRVKKGELLARLDAQENQATAAASSAGIEDARRGVEEAQARRKLAETTFGRFQKLLDEQAVTRQEFDVKQTERDLAVQGVARAEARLKQAREGGRALSVISGYTQIIAPISGIITSKQADLGATVYPAQPLMTIEDERSYQLELAIPESMAARVKPGSSVLVTLDAANSSFAAKIAEIVPTVDPVSRTYTAKINLSMKGLKSGMFCRGSIALETASKGIAVAHKAIIEQGALTSVWVVANDRIAHMRLIKAGKKLGDKVEILSGLAAGEQVVIAGAEQVTEGAKVE